MVGCFLLALCLGMKLWPFIFLRSPWRNLYQGEDGLEKGGGSKDDETCELPRTYVWTFGILLLLCVFLVQHYRLLVKVSSFLDREWGREENLHTKR